MLFDAFEVEKEEIVFILDIISSVDGIRKRTYQDKKAKAPKT